MPRLGAPVRKCPPAAAGVTGWATRAGWELPVPWALKSRSLSKILGAPGKFHVHSVCHSGVGPGVTGMGHTGSALDPIPTSPAPPWRESSSWIRLLLQDPGSQEKLPPKHQGVLAGREGLGERGGELPVDPCVVPAGSLSFLSVEVSHFSAWGGPEGRQKPQLGPQIMRWCRGAAPTCG